MGKMSLVVRVLAAATLQLACGASALAGAMHIEEFAVEVAAEGNVVQSVAQGRQVTGVAFRTEPGGCKVVGAWYDALPRGIRNYRVCGSKVSSEGTVARLPRGKAMEVLVEKTMKGAVMRGESQAKFEEFAIKAVRLSASDGGASCTTELVITVDGLLSFYGVQETCN